MDDFDPLDTSDIYSLYRGGEMPYLESGVSYLPDSIFFPPEETPVYNPFLDFASNVPYVQVPYTENIFPIPYDPAYVNREDVMGYDAPDFSPEPPSASYIPDAGSIAAPSSAQGGGFWDSLKNGFNTGAKILGTAAGITSKAISGQDIGSSGSQSGVVFPTPSVSNPYQGISTPNTQTINGFNFGPFILIGLGVIALILVMRKG